MMNWTPPKIFQESFGIILWSPMFIHSLWNHFKVCFGTQGVELRLNKRANGSADGNPPWNLLDLDISLDLESTDRRPLTPAAFNIYGNIWAGQRWAQQTMMGSHHSSGVRMPLNHTRTFMFVFVSIVSVFFTVAVTRNENGDSCILF